MIAGMAYAGGAAVHLLRRSAGRLILLAFAFLLASCSSGGVPGSGFNIFDGPQPSTQKFENIGKGSVKVALLLPLSADGDAGATARALKEAAELALFEFDNPDIVLVLKDTQGTASGAAAAAQQAISEGAELIVGPLFAQSVSAVGPIARNANVPVIAFSTDANVAGRGIYLLSFLPSDDIAQIVNYAAGKGKRSLAALVPENAFGTLAEGALKQTAANSNAQVVAIERYPTDRNAMSDPVKRLAEVAKGKRPKVSALLMPDGPAAVLTLSSLLTLNGVDPKRVKFLGSGQWEDPAIGREPALAGAWYAAPDPAGWRSFVSRFQATYGAQPPRIASISYDAVSLAAALARFPAGERYAAKTLTNPNGFAGVDGLFRFLPNGLNQRGLAILEVQPGGGGRVIEPAPNSFAARSF